MVFFPAESKQFPVKPLFYQIFRVVLHEIHYFMADNFPPVFDDKYRMVCQAAHLMGASIVSLFWHKYTSKSIFNRTCNFVIYVL